jgi:tRNA pseudouridine38-40 synthase
MHRPYLATLQFDGSGFVGWQRQAVGRSVQGEMERVLARLEGTPVTVFGAGRTDAGVHALGYAASFSARASWEPAKLAKALDALLPDEVWVQAVHPMRAGFHARKCADGRRYVYDVGTDAACRSPFRRGREWALGRTLDGDRLAAAAAQIRGEHDFTAFSVRGQDKAHHRCRIRAAAWSKRPDDAGWRFHVAADRFLHHMVRMLVGTMVEIGLGRRPVDDMARLLGRAANDETSPPAPAEGLYFEAAEYAADWYAPEDPSAVNEASS